MNESTDAKSELDQYGVWVKTPPRDAQNAAEPVPKAEDTDSLPNFSFVEEDSAPQTEEVKEIAPEPEVPEIPADIPSPSGETDISVDSFLSDDSAGPAISDGDVSLDEFLSDVPSTDNFTPDGDVSLDAFLDPSETAQTETVQEESPEEAPLDIDLTFDDSAAVPETADSIIDSTVDLPDISDISIDETSSASSSGSEELSVDDFMAPEENTQSPASGGTDENIDLSEFGINEEDDNPNVAMEEEKKEPEKVDYNLSVSDDDEVAAPIVEEQVSHSAAGDATAKVSSEDALELKAELTELKGKVSDLETQVQQLKDAIAALSSAPAAKEEPFSIPEESSEPVAADIPAAEDIPSFEESVPEESETPVVEAAPKSAGGFFGDSDDDDTIALSGDELSNILTSVEFTTADADTPTFEEIPSATEEAPAIEEDVAAEPIVESAEETGLPEEIDLPKNDILVESSGSDFMEEVSGEPEETTESVADDIPPLSDENIEFLSSSDETPLEEDEELETGISENPVGTVFNSWQNAGDNTEDTGVASVAEDLAIPEATEEDFSEPAPAAEEFPAVENVFDESAAEEAVPTVDTIESTAEEAPVEADAFAGSEPVIEESTEEVPAFDEAVPVAEDTAFEEVAPAEDTAFEEAAPAEEPAFEEAAPAEEPVIEESPVEEVVPSAEDIAALDRGTEFSYDETPAADAEDAQVIPPEYEESTAAPAAAAPSTGASMRDIPEDMKAEIKSVLSYMDQLLENLPEEKITEFAQSEQFETYKKLFSELGLA